MEKQVKKHVKFQPYTDEDYERMIELTQVGFRDLEIAEITGFHAGKIASITTDYWMMKMRKHDLNREPVLIQTKKSKPIVLNINNEKAIVVIKCLSCATIRDKKSEFCNVCK
jgi:hypothetical protein